MNRTEFIRRLVLNEISDDWENIDQIILPEAVDAGAKCGYAIERADVVEALSTIVRDGLARAAILSSREPFVTDLPSMPPVSLVEENFSTYFYITPKGMDLHLSDDSWWPFQDEQDA
jgi:hypothetical protein